MILDSERFDKFKHSSNEQYRKSLLSHPYTERSTQSTTSSLLKKLFGMADSGPGSKTFDNGYDMFYWNVILSRFVPMVYKKYGHEDKGANHVMENLY